MPTAIAIVSITALTSTLAFALLIEPFPSWHSARGASAACAMASNGYATPFFSRIQRLAPEIGRRTAIRR
jgi:hypothetical protein